VILGVGGRLVMSGGMSIGAFVAFGLYLAQLVWPMIALGWAVSLIQRGAASMRRLNDIFASAPTIVDPAEPSPSRRPPVPAAGDGGGLLQVSGGGRPRVGAAGYLVRLAAGESLAVVGATDRGRAL